MAIRKITEGVSNWNNRTPWPKDRYTVVCLEEELGKSSGNNPMITRTFEVVSPETKEVGDKIINVAGSKVTQYAITKVHEEGSKGAWDDEKSDKAFGRFRDDLLICGFTGEQIDDENPPLYMKGKTFEVIIYGKKDVSRQSPTPEQLRKGIKQGEPIKDAAGNDVITYQLQIEQFLGLSTTQKSVAF